ncbi:MAG: hypothetical protein ABFD96_18845, partial [Armatimonadia bacterium]
DSPLGYAGGRMDFGNWIRSLKMATLLVGTRYNYTHGISAYCFPFTPIELHAGYLLGQERIITLHDGNYGWPGQRCLVQARYFDKEGKLTDKSFKTIVDKEARTAVQVTPDEALVLVKLPATIATGQATVENATYDANALRCLLQTAKGCTLTVKSGDLAIKPGQKLTAKIGDATTTLTADRNGEVNLKVPATANPVAISIAAQ